MSYNPSRQIGVSDLTGDERRSVEHLLGQPLQENQQVYILAFTPGVVPDEKTCQRALTSMRQAFAAAERHAQAHGIDDSEFDAAVDEALEHVRYGRP